MDRGQDIVQGRSSCSVCQIPGGTNSCIAGGHHVDAFARDAEGWHIAECWISINDSGDFSAHLNRD